jgi:3-keto-disaccharide hydrolase
MRRLLLAATTLLLALPGLAEEAKALWNGHDLTGWTHVGPGTFVVENGVLKTAGGMGLLYWNGGKIADSVVRVVYRNEKRESNAGVFIRIPEAPTEPWMPVNRGYEVQICDAEDDTHVTGVLYSLTKAKARPGRPGEWNTLEISLDGPRTRVTVNGTLVTDYKEGDAVPPKAKPYEPDRGRRPDAGFIGLQNHDDKDVVYFKEISVHPLPKE